MGQPLAALSEGQGRPESHARAKIDAEIGEKSRFRMKTATPSGSARSYNRPDLR